MIAWGTVGLALCWLAAIGIMLALAWKALTTPVHTAPHDLADALGRLADAERVPFTGKVLRLTEQERHDAKVKLHLISTRARGQARIATFPNPKDVA